ncbi:hypothetical protein FGADI_5087 [Fusarium gaditjirri]|uniref:Uncharacterized protein n=1 Tax=Fusarium gaditjirri TaxID=282569 RepID=A0A8H4TBD9_9HYPO|nr:hypothetical protein FGADI_5087 [Fusarium gaditjirri]
MQFRSSSKVPGLASKCALELENTKNFLECFRMNFRWHGEDIARGLVDHLRKYFDGKEQGIDSNFCGDEEWMLKIKSYRELKDPFCGLFHGTCHLIRLVSFTKSPELYKSSLEHAGQQLDFTVEDLKSGLAMRLWSRGSQLIELLKEAHVNGARQETLRILEWNCKTFNENKELWLRRENHGIYDNCLKPPLIKILEADEARTIPAV